MRFVSYSSGSTLGWGVLNGNGLVDSRQMDA
jgi:hypothetical protein